MTPFNNNNANVSSSGSYTPDWKNRFPTLNPHWYQTQKVIRIVGSVFLVLGATLAATTGCAFFAFTATPAVVIGTTSALLLLTIATAIVGIVCFAKRTFWKDPKYVCKQGQKAWEELIKNDLSYLQIQQKYQNLINNYAVFNSKDYNEVVRKDTLDFSRFIQRHGYQVLNILDETNRNSLKEAFLNFIKKEMSQNLTFSQLLQYGFVIEKLDVKHKELEDILYKDLDKLSYSAFMEKHQQATEKPMVSGRQFILSQETEKLMKSKCIDEMSKNDLSLSDIELRYSLNKDWLQEIADKKTALLLEKEISYLDLKKKIGLDYMMNLNEDSKTKIKIKFLATLHDLNEGLLNTKKEFSSDQNPLDVTDSEFANAVLTKEMDNLNKKLCKYDLFIARNGIECIKYLHEWDKPKVRDALIEACKELDKGLIFIQQSFKEHFKVFGITEKEITKVILPLEFSKLKKNLCTYADFVKRNGSVILSELSQLDQGISRFKLLEHCKNSGLGFSQLKTQFGDDFKFLRISDNEIVTAVVDKEFNDLKSNKTTYARFRQRNGFEVIQNLAMNPSDKQSLKDIFLSLPYSEMTNKTYEQDRTSLDITQQEIQRAISLNAQATDYFTFINFHGIQVLQDQELVEDALRNALKDKLLMALKEKNYPEIASHSTEFKLLSISNKEIRALIKSDMENLSYIDFKKKHTLAPVRDRILESHSLANKLKELIKTVPSVEHFKEDCSTLGVNWAEALKVRWYNRSIMTTLSEEKDLFYNSIRQHEVSGTDMRSKVLYDTQSQSAWLLFKDYRELFNFGILTVKDISYRFEQEIGSKYNLESFLTEYGDVVFEQGLLDRNSKTFNRLLIDYFSRYSNLILENENFEPLRKIERFGYFPSYITSILAQAKTNFNNLQSYCSIQNGNVDRQYTSDLQNAESEKHSQILAAKRQMNIEKFENEFKAIKRLRDQAQQQVLQAKNSLDEALKKQSNVQVESQVLDNKNRERRSEIQKLTNELNADISAPAQAFEKDIKDLEDRIKKSKETPVTGVMAAHKANKEISSLETELKGKRKMFDDLKNQPEKIKGKIVSLEKEISSTAEKLIRLKNSLEQSNEEVKRLQINNAQQNQDSLKRYEMQMMDAERKLNSTKSDLKQVLSLAESNYQNATSRAKMTKQQAVQGIETYFTSNIAMIKQNALVNLNNGNYI